MRLRQKSREVDDLRLELSQSFNPPGLQHRKRSQMAYKANVKTTFEPSRIIQPIHTGGSVALSQDGKVIATCLGEEALLTDLNTGEHLARIEGVSVALQELQAKTDN